MAQDRKYTGFVIFICDTIISVSVIIACLQLPKLTSNGSTTLLFNQSKQVAPHTHTHTQYLLALGNGLQDPYSDSKANIMTFMDGTGYSSVSMAIVTMVSHLRVIPLSF
eukprot:320913_1